MKFIIFQLFLEGAVFLKRRKMPSVKCLVIVCDPAYADDNQQRVYDDKMVSI